MNWKKILLYTGIVLYILSPIDIIPLNPIDDIIVSAIGIWIDRKLLK